MTDALLLMGHGSRDPEGMAEFVELAAAVRAAALGVRVEAGVLEFPTTHVPYLQDAIDRCVAGAADRILGVPVLLHHAGHSKDDMPAQIASARARHPQVEFYLFPSLGADPRLREIAEERVRQVEEQLDAAGAPRRPGADSTAVLLVGRGSHDPDANADFFKLGRLLWERNRYRFVECCFVSLTGPGVPEGIERCVRLGARRVLVIPYFLHTGVLVKRIVDQAAASRALHQGVEIAVGRHLGADDRLVQLIAERARALGCR